MHPMTMSCNNGNIVALVAKKLKAMGLLARDVRSELSLPANVACR